MQTSTSSTPVPIVRSRLAVALAIGALTVLSTRAYATEPDEITVTAPAVKTVARDYATGAPIEEVTVSARVAFDPVTLTTNSGVALLKDSVREAARKACATADPLTQDDGTCFYEAVKGARPQVAAAIAQARSNAVNG